MVNEVFDESTLLRQYRDEIDRLKRELAKVNREHKRKEQDKRTR
jgi:hypothetical protein